MSINLKNKQDIIKEYGANEKDTGSAEVQIAMLSTKISELTEHLKKGHTWKDENWGYETLPDKIELTSRYIQFINTLIDLVPQGISGAIYTQTTDVEGEINGLMTYDRYETKVFDTIKEAHERLIASLS